MWPVTLSALEETVLLFHLHDVDGHPYGCSDEHDVSIYGEVLAYRPQHGFVDQYGREDVDEGHAEDCRYDL